MDRTNDEAWQFEYTFARQIQPGTRGIDLGAGDGELPARLAESYDMVAVDKRAPDYHHDRLIWRQMSVEDWAIEPDGEPFDFILSRNLVQFLDKPFVFETLLPAIKRRVKPDGVIAIKTFSANPEPALGIAFPTFFRVEEIAAHFDGWTVVLSINEPRRSRALDGPEIRLWQTVQFIARRPLNS